MTVNKIYNEDCLNGLKRIETESIDCVLTDPPYLYLKHKLDRPFDEHIFFSEIKRVLKKDGFIILFGRGTSFYRWNTTLANLGFTFKEEIIWSKGYCTSPLMRLSRVHETISLHTKGNGTIRKSKVPYLEMKKYDIPSIITDIKRLRTTFGNPKSLAAVLSFLENNKVPLVDDCEKNMVSVSSDIKVQDRCASVMGAITNGCKEKSIIRDDFNKNSNVGITGASSVQANKACTVMQAVECGMNEKSIIKETPDHYKAIHPTEKPVKLLERLLNLVCAKDALILDPFSGSGSTAIACLNSNRKYIGFEIDKEYFDKSIARIKDYSSNTELNLNL